MIRQSRKEHYLNRKGLRYIREEGCFATREEFCAHIGKEGGAWFGEERGTVLEKMDVGDMDILISQAINGQDQLAKSKATDRSALSKLPPESLAEKFDLGVAAADSPVEAKKATGLPDKATALLIDKTTAPFTMKKYILRLTKAGSKK